MHKEQKNYSFVRITTDSYIVSPTIKNKTKIVQFLMFQVLISVHCKC